MEAVGFFMCIVGFLITGSSLANDYWKISTVSGSVIISQRQFENLWHACAENSAGIAECRDFESMLSLPKLDANIFSSALVSFLPAPNLSYSEHFQHLCVSAAHVQACRALMIIALLFCLGCMIVSLLGLKCIKIGSTADETKAKMAMAGGILCILGGTSSRKHTAYILSCLCSTLEIVLFLKLQ
ncbi:hypothetical protein XENOCAPTIV_010001 [Xenoophorus captivus]|uniref:Claudin n=1 Tax=Xenoophorus captivus TaxID=1517983 RepID=A0ABV0RRT0_9TELE